MRYILTKADAAPTTSRLASMSIKTQGSERAVNNNGDRENDHRDGQYDHEADDDDEFFDAEDASLGGHIVANDADALDHDASN